MSALTLSQAVDSLSCQLSKLAVDTPDLTTIQLAETVEAMPLMSWLATQPHFPKIYWQGRDQSDEVAVVGSCLNFAFEHPTSDQALAEIYKHQSNHNNPEIRYYGGVAFDRNVKSWDEFGRVRFILPRIEFRRVNKNYRLLLNLSNSEQTLTNDIQAALTALAQIVPAKPLQPQNKTELLKRTDIPNAKKWKSLVEEVTETSFNQRIPKVVLSRFTQLDVTESPDPWKTLANWQGRNPNSFQFGFQFSPTHSFISCSPERLYRKDNNNLQTEALAGTTTRGVTEQGDEQLALALMDDYKNTHENSLVRQEVVAALTPLSHEVIANDTPTIFKLSHIQHLHRAIRAKLKNNVTDFDLLKALHPTPAVGGLPKNEALSYLTQNEGYTRGWYAGACGYLNKNQSEFSVAIRCALIEPKKINLFAGAGIVSGSKADEEWQELENKIATIMSILLDF